MSAAAERLTAEDEAPSAPDEALERLTAEQREAVERRAGPLFLHAGAGSGKTTVLVERFVRSVVDDGVPVDGILAITFTERAAGELRRRLRARLLELSEPARAREVERSWVGTIHGLCSRLLRAHAVAAGLDPEYRVLDEPRAARLSLAAWDEALDAFLAPGAPERLELLARYGPDTLASMVRTVYERRRSLGERRPSLPALAPVAAGGEAEELREAAAAALAGFALVEGGVTVGRARAKVERCVEALASPLDHEAPGEEERFAGFAFAAGNARALDTPAVRRHREALEAWRALCLQARGTADYALLAVLLDLYGERYEARKAARSALDFEDLQLAARDLLRDAPGVRERERRRFHRIMVDEAQDTNEPQWSVVQQLARDNVFTVGDPLQSIYGFRNADLGLFRRRAAAAEAEGAAASLRTNFRSAPAVLAAVNDASVSAFGPGFEPLRAGREPDEAAGPVVELLLVDRTKAVWEDAGLGDHPFGPSLRAATPWRAAEARLLADRVAALVGEERACAPGEVAVLVRSTADLGIYERALAERGLPTYAAGGRGYWAQQQVADLRAYLAVLANPLDDLALHQALASPLGGASLDALVLLRLRAAGRPAWEALEAAFGSDPEGAGEGLAGSLAPWDRETLAAFATRVAGQRRAAARRSLEAVIEEAVTASGYDRAVLALPGGRRRLANVRKLMRLARAFEGEEGRDLRAFVDFLGEQERLEAREGEAALAVEEVDAVRLMTVHAAKGLEFPVVCLADLGRRGRADDSALRVADGGRVGLRIASLAGGGRRALELEAMEADQVVEAEEEERRVFYVGMTRAQRRLVLSGATDLARWPEANPLGEPMSWVWRGVAPGLRKAAAEAARGELLGPGGAPLAFRVLTPATLDELLPPAARRPEPEARLGGPGAPGGGAGPGDPDPDGGAPGVDGPAHRAARARSSALRPEAHDGRLRHRPTAPPRGRAARHAPLPGQLSLFGVAPTPGAGAAAAGAAPAVATATTVALPQMPHAGGRVMPASRFPAPVPAPSPVAPVPRPPVSRVSYSALEGYARCPYRFYLERVLDLPPPADLAPSGRGGGRELLARARGTVAHELLERVTIARPSLPAARHVAERLRANGVRAHPAGVEELRGLVAGWVASEFFARLGRAERVRTELAFRYPLVVGPDVEVLVDGVLDVHAAEPGGSVLVVDHKTDRLGGRDPEDAVAGAYATQRLVYALAALRAGAERVEVAHCFLERPDRPASAIFAREDRADVEARLVGLAGGVVEGRWAPTDRPHAELCRSCPGRAALCTWPTERTLSASP